MPAAIWFTLRYPPSGGRPRRAGRTEALTCVTKGPFTEPAGLFQFSSCVSVLPCAEDAPSWCGRKSGPRSLPSLGVRPGGWGSQSPSLASVSWSVPTALCRSSSFMALVTVGNHAFVGLFIFLCWTGSTRMRTGTCLLVPMLSQVLAHRCRPSPERRPVTVCHLTKCSRDQTRNDR